uniref:Uncharacterized protein n=1 Tax=Arundo donax TaxID=35708 RepID=A0A0A9B7H9_ARUDO
MRYNYLANIVTYEI